MRTFQAPYSMRLFGITSSALMITEATRSVPLSPTQPRYQMRPYFVLIARRSNLPIGMLPYTSFRSTWYTARRRLPPAIDFGRRCRDTRWDRARSASSGRCRTAPRAPGTSRPARDVSRSCHSSAPASKPKRNAPINCHALRPDRSSSVVLRMHAWCCACGAGTTIAGPFHSFGRRKLRQVDGRSAADPI